jgi:hypothetical protein
MEVEESGSSWLGRVNRFCYQCLQLEQVLDYPEGEILRRPEAQDVIFHNVFSDETVRYGPPARYRVKVLKELVKRIEASIEDWDQHVRIPRVGHGHIYMHSPLGLRFMLTA